MTPWPKDHPLDQSMDHLYGPLRQLTIKIKTRHTAIISTQSETQISFGTNSVLFCEKETILSRFEAGCLLTYIQLADMGHHFQKSVNRSYLLFFRGLEWAGRKGITTFFLLLCEKEFFGGGEGNSPDFISFVL